MSTYIRNKNTAVLKTNGVMWRSIRNRNVRFPDIYTIFVVGLYMACFMVTTLTFLGHVTSSVT